MGFRWRVPGDLGTKAGLANSDPQGEAGCRVDVVRSGADEDRCTSTGSATAGRERPPPGPGDEVLQTQRSELAFHLTATGPSGESPMDEISVS